VDFSALLAQRLPLVVGFVLGLTFLLVLWTFRSVVVAATAIGLNLLSVGAAYGLMVLVFQHTWAEGLLDFRSNGAIVAWLPMFLFVVLFGLSMDYHVFVVSRIRELALRGMPTRDAVRQGIVSSAGAVTSAAVVMVAVFAIFATLSGLEFKQMGVGLAGAVLIDATLVRAVLLPAAMTLLGRWNWWTPALLRRRQPVAEDTPGDLVRA
jgi:RND superfamily putative drug exporter